MGTEKGLVGKERGEERRWGGKEDKGGDQCVVSFISNSIRQWGCCCCCCMSVVVVVFFGFPAILTCRHRGRESDRLSTSSYRANQHSARASCVSQCCVLPSNRRRIGSRVQRPYRARVYLPETRWVYSVECANAHTHTLLSRLGKPVVILQSPLLRRRRRLLFVPPLYYCCCCCRYNRSADISIYITRTRSIIQPAPFCLLSFPLLSSPRWTERRWRRRRRD